MSDIVKVRKDIRINLETGSPYSFDMKVSEFKEWLDEIVSQAPPEFQDDVEIEIRATTSYDCAELEVEVSYLRPETEEEEKFRLETEQNREDDRKRFELRQLSELQKKYGVKK